MLKAIILNSLFLLGQRMNFPKEVLQCICAIVRINDYDLKWKDVGHNGA